MNDIIPPNRKRSIRDIPIPDKGEDGNGYIQEKSEQSSRTRHHSLEKKRSIKRKDEEEYEEDEEYEDIEAEYDEDDEIETANHHSKKSRRLDSSFYKKNSGPKKVILGVIFLAVLLFFIVIAFRNGAEVIVEPKTLDTTVTTEIQAINASAENQEAANGLSFTTETTTVSVSETVVATGEENVEEKASGTITISNEFSENPQRLITKTRFESPNGKVYRIQESISVPGYTEDASGNKTAGTISVTVVADEAGESFNIGKTDFTIPGFAGQPQFESIRAKSETAMTGGYSGVRKFVEDDEMNRIEELLHVKAASALTSQTTSINPDVYAFSTSSLQTFTLSQKSEGQNIVFTLEGEAKVIAFNKNAFANAIASASITTFDATKEQVVVLMNDELLIDVVPNVVPGSDRDVADAMIVIDGPVQFTWVIDTDALSNALVGMERKTFRNILESVPGIQKAEVTIKPFWKNSFPDSATKIEIIVEKDNRCDGSRC